MRPPDALRKATAKFCHFHFGKINPKIKTPPESKGRLQVRRRFPGGERGCICAFQGRTRTYTGSRVARYNPRFKSVLSFSDGTHIGKSQGGVWPLQAAGAKNPGCGRQAGYAAAPS